MNVRSGNVRLSCLALSAAMLIAACTSGGGAIAPSDVASSAPTTGASTASPDTRQPDHSSSGIGSSAPSSSGTAVVLDQAWATAELVDAATGESFRIADHAGQVIVVETMAIWCSSCLSQQRDVQAALERLPADRVVYIVLDADASENLSSLAAYQDQYGFAGRYAIAGKDVARALAADFGDQFLNPPSTPMAIIGTDGTVTRTEFGHKSADEIVALVKAHGA